MEHSRTTPPRLAIVIPCYNEAATLPATLAQLSDCLDQWRREHLIATDSYLYCVDDGSHDDTWAIIHHHHERCPWIKGLKLTRNAGHQNALLAGLLHIKRAMDCVITIDADLQDDINAIPLMLAHYQNGMDIVYGVRVKRTKDNLFKRLTAHLFYRIMRKSGANIIHNHADFRLMSQRVVISLSRFRERHLFLRGIVPWMGYRSAEVYYERRARQFGHTQYTLTKMLRLAWDGITSFSHLPLNLIMGMGVFSFIASLAMTLWAIAAKYAGNTIPGWTSIMIPLCFMGGVQLLSIGVIGEYVAKVYFEVKNRPRFIKEAELP